MPSLSPLQAGLRTPSGQEGYTKENEITVLNFDKSKQVVCEISMFSKSEIDEMPWET